MSCSKAENSEVKLFQNKSTKLIRINKCPLIKKAIGEKRYLQQQLDVASLLLLFYLFFFYLILTVMLPLMAYEIRQIKSTLNGKNHSNQDQRIFELLHQLTSLMKQINSKICLDFPSNQFIADIQELFEFDSCNFLENFSVQLPSGLYKIMPQDALTSSKVYCSYQSFSGRNEWWRRVAHLNTSKSYQVQCTSGLETRRESPSSCRRAVEERGCSSVYFDPGDVPYSRVGGRVRARQPGQPDGFQDFNGPRFRGEVSLEDNYVDGISLTYGDEGNRKHIWTFATTRRDGCAVCDREIPDFIGDHYSCELV